MKKLLAILLAVLTMFIFTACGNFTCEQCGKESSGKKHTVEAEGVKANLCSDCYKEYQEMMKSIEDLEESLGDLEKSLGDLEGLE